MKTRLFEIFTSIEGEGILYGTKTLFVRLAGCPYSCFYCDTLDALPLDSGNEYSITEACELIDKNLQENTYKVNFTGGEPLIQHQAVSKLAKHVKSKGIPTYLESACFDSKKFMHVLPSIDYVKIEFKTTVSLGELLDKIFQIVLKGKISGFIIQPTTGISEPSLEKLMEFYDSVYSYYNEVRVVPQLHKIIKAP